MAIAADVKAGPRPVSFGMGVVGLLALAMFINYVDRGNLATAAPLMKDELRLSASQLGLLLSVFYWTYVPGQLLAGWLAEKINPYRAYALGLAMWSLSTALTGVASGFSMLIVLRLLLGLGESTAFPCSSKLIAQHMPQHRLGIANGLVSMGLSLGPAFGTLAGGLLMAKTGWRPVFLLFGLASLLWLWPWLSATRRLSAAADEPKRDLAPSFLAIMGRREAWGAGLGHFCNNYAFYFVISWLPLYLVKSRGFTVSQMAELGGAIYVIYAAASIGTGWISDRWMAAGGSSNRVRKTVVIAGHALTAAAMAGCMLGTAPVAIASLFLAAVGFGLISPSLYAIGQTLAGPRGGGNWIAFQNALGNVAGIVAPIVTGAVVDRTGQFTWAFAVAGLAAVGGVLSWGFVVRKIAPLAWPGALITADQAPGSGLSSP
ncbi:MFS transporter [Phenylobacterium sp.]|uniref:MFS transporter n=1 Tax=Phenylobacterium sp. TaxID=1871053 RepID=UPI0025F92C7C|nr:MFS transporter [Phenylobacterium sp.]